VESYEGPDSGSQTQSALHLSLGEGAKLEHTRVQREGAGSLHLHRLTAWLDARAELRHVALDFGKGVARAELDVEIAGEAASFDLAKTAKLSGTAHADTTLVLRHASVGSTSRELYKAAVDGAARSVFQGRIAVAEGAQQTDAKMMARALLLSEEARADCKPELEIFADDVQCGHGAAIGALDPESLFYLMARGLPEREAEALLIEAFAREPLEGVADEGLRAALTALVSDWLNARG
jgi:Fe-S cluster assembly protein SufD